MRKPPLVRGNKEEDRLKEAQLLVETHPWTTFDKSEILAGIRYEMNELIELQREKILKLYSEYRQREVGTTVTPKFVRSVRFYAYLEALSKALLTESLSYFNDADFMP